MIIQKKIPLTLWLHRMMATKCYKLVFVKYRNICRDSGTVNIGKVVTGFFVNCSREHETLKS
jgi:hypothetical protein